MCRAGCGAKRAQRAETEPGLLYLESWGQIDSIYLLDLISTQYQLFKLRKFQEVFIHQAHLGEKARKLSALVGEAGLQQKASLHEDEDGTS